MKNVIVAIVVVTIGAVGWRIGGRLSPDAMGLATGVVFGVLAGLPTALLVLASNRSRRRRHDFRPCGSSSSSDRRAALRRCSPCTRQMCVRGANCRLRCHDTIRIATRIPHYLDREEPSTSFGVRRSRRHWRCRRAWSYRLPERVDCCACR